MDAGPSPMDGAAPPDAGPADGSVPDAGPPTPEARLRAEADGPAIVRLDSDGRLRTVIADLPAAGATPEARAEGFVEAHPELLPLDDAIETFTRFVSEDGSVVALGLRADGVEVFGAEIRVVFSSADRIHFVAAIVPSDPLAAGATPGIDAAAAVAAARAALALPPEPSRVGTPELRVLDEAMLDGAIGAARLTWMMEVDDGTAAASALAFVDASTSALVTTVPLSATALSRTIHDAEYEEDKSTLVGTLLFEDATSTRPPMTEADGWAVYGNLERAYDYFSSRFGRDGFDGSGAVSAYVHYPGEGAQHWAGSMYFTDGWTGLDVVVHEYAHSIIDHTGTGLYLRLEPGAINESLSDSFAAFVDVETPWTIGDGSARVLRDFVDPTRFGDPRTYETRQTGDAGACAATMPACADGRTCVSGLCYEDSGWIHYNSGILNHATYLLAEGGVHLDTAIEVRGIGRDKVGQLLYGGLSAAPAASQMRDWRETVLAACLIFESPSVPNPLGIERQDCGAALNAFAAVGIGEPDPDEDALVGAEDNCPYVYNPDQEVIDGEVCDGVTRCPGEVIVCPPTFTGADGVLQLLGEDDPVQCFTTPAGTPPTYRARCSYAPEGELGNVVFNSSYFDTIDERMGCLVDAMGHDVDQPTSWFPSTTRRARVEFAGPGDRDEDPARRAFAESLLPQFQRAAALCERVECPESFNDGTGEFTLRSDSRATIPALGTNGSDVVMRANCAYDPGPIVFNLLWAQREGESLACPAMPMPEDFVVHDGIVQAHVRDPRTGDPDVDAVRRAVATAMYEQIRPRALPCP